MSERAYISEGLGEVCMGDVINVVFDQEMLTQQKYLDPINAFRHRSGKSTSINSVFELKILGSRAPDFARYTISYRPPGTDETHEIWAGNSHFGKDKVSLIYTLVRVTKDRRLDPVKSITTGRSW